MELFKMAAVHFCPQPSSELLAGQSAHNSSISPNVRNLSATGKILSHKTKFQKTGKVHSFHTAHAGCGRCGSKVKLGLRGGR